MQLFGRSTKVTGLIISALNMKKQNPPALKFSENISLVNLWQFKKVVETGNVKYLLKLSNYDELPDCDIDELSDAWYKIYAEFSEIVGGNRADLWLVKHKRLLLMKLNYELGATILRVVQKLPVKETIEAAKEHGYIIDPDNLKPTFEKAYTKLMRLKNKISIIESESKQETDESEKEDFDGLIATLEKFQGYQFDEHAMSVKKFANIYKNYKNAREQDK